MASWRSLLTTKHLRKLPESRIRALQCHDCLAERSEDRPHLIPGNAASTARPVGIPVCYQSTRKTESITSSEINAALGMVNIHHGFGRIAITPLTHRGAGQCDCIPDAGASPSGPAVQVAVRVAVDRPQCGPHRGHLVPHGHVDRVAT